MLQRTASRSASRTLSRAAPAASSSRASLSAAAVLAPLRTSASSSLACSSQHHSLASPVASGSLRTYSIEITRKTDFADKGPIAFDEVKALTETPGKAYIIDVRELEEIQQGNIPSSLPLPLSKLDDALKMTPGDFEAAFGFHKPEPDAPIVVYCRSGKRSTSAKEKMESKDLKANRYTNIRNYNGSWLDWSEKYKPAAEEDDE